MEDINAVLDPRQMSCVQIDSDMMKAGAAE
jgi:hypothetical protein